MADDVASSLEYSLQACISLLGVDVLDKGKGQQCIDNKLGVEAAITSFLESAKLVEEDFIRKQAYVRVHHPQETLKQEISHLKTEIKQKEDILSKLSEKVDYWTKILDELQRKQKAEIEAMLTTGAMGKGSFTFKLSYKVGVMLSRTKSADALLSIHS
ncbi:mediator of RNA polymerase II transcription subunit 28-like [Actinia tenebrosa]|uniref:Mediator of RNA polymerase II transcription subunit 28 n=1 Tax=Actinia tenebrosa TaxID=6105 RepID=A0A6P8HGK7_ACTTE|nr:mediator of RNA polymerase II transcription subunit 28-like [Actinia tenebrosa]